MKVKALRNFLWRDTKTEQMLHCKEGEIYDFNVELDASAIFEAVCGRSIAITDTEYLPNQGRYVGLRDYHYRRADGTLLKISVGQVVILSQSDAGKCLIDGLVKPESPTTWKPKDLIVGAVATGAPKKMYDEPQEAKESWISRGRRE